MMLLQRATLLVLILVGRAVVKAVPKNNIMVKHDKDEVKRVKKRRSKEILKLPGAQGVGISYNDKEGKDAYIVAYVEDESAVARIPKELDGVPVRTEVSGTFQALGKRGIEGEGEAVSRELQSCPVQGPGNCRPALLGVSVSNDGAGSQGTLGARVVDSSGDVYVLSNHHVIGELGSSFPGAHQPQVGDYTLQPANGDGGNACCTDEDIIAELWDWVDIIRDADDPNPTCNYVDAAIAKAIDPNIIGTSTIDTGWTPKTVTDSAVPGMRVKKCGRTTGCNVGVVDAVDVDVVVDYGIFYGKALFCDQIIVSPPFHQGGDSGSLVMRARESRASYYVNRPVGLLFAGNSTQTVLNPIDLVLNSFGVTIDGV